MPLLSTAPAGAGLHVPPGTRPLVSIIAPVFNEASTLPELMRRLVDVTQTLEPRYAFEFLLVDDGSSDRTLDVAAGISATEPRLSVVSLRRNYGQTAAL